MPRQTKKSSSRSNQIDQSKKSDAPLGIKLYRTLEEQEDIVHSIAFDPTGQVFATASRDSCVKLWDVNTGELQHILEWHEEPVYSIAFNTTGTMLASGSQDRTVRLWDVASGKLLSTLVGHQDSVYGVAFDPTGRFLATGSADSTIKIWKLRSPGSLDKITFKGHRNWVNAVAFDPTGKSLASASDDGTIKIWDVDTGRRHTLKGHSYEVLSLAFRPDNKVLVSGGQDCTVKVWDAESGRELYSLEGHTGPVEAVAFFHDGSLLASKSLDGTIRLWSGQTWQPLVIISEPREPKHHVPGLAFHPRLPFLAIVGSRPEAHWDETSKLVHFLKLDLKVLLGDKSRLQPAEEKAVHHTTAKIVLVGDHGAGKSGLGYRLANAEYKDQSSSHGQQFWVLPQLASHRNDGTECEAILWDLAGQPDYRLTHALFLDDVDLALVVFDASNISEPLRGVEFWLKQLEAGKMASQSEFLAGQKACAKILVGGITDRGTPPLTSEEIRDFCVQRGIGAYVPTSAKEGWGLEDLIIRMRELIPWEQKSATVTTITFKRIKDYVLRLKETKDGQHALVVTPEQLREQLEAQDSEWRFTNAEMMTTIGHLENYGYVKRLRTSEGEERILLAPELLNNLAASFVLEARRNPRGLGSLEEQQLMQRGYRFPELESLELTERDILIDAATLLFLEHNVCFRQTDPLGGRSYLVFPELINSKKPILDGQEPTEDGVSYRVIGAIEHVYASLVVLLGYTQTFMRTNQWHNQAHYEMGDGLVCGFRQEAERDGELELVLYFGTRVGQPVRALFQGLFESFLASRNVEVFRYETVICLKCSNRLAREVASKRLSAGKDFAYCSECGERLDLPTSHDPIQLTQTEQEKIDEQQWFAANRSRFERAIYQVMSYVEGEGLTRPQCFISYAWGDTDHERWVEHTLATDLQKAGITVILDKWQNARAGKSVTRFVSSIGDCDLVMPIGTPSYVLKFKNMASAAGSIVSAEVDLISQRLVGTELEKETVMPVLRQGDKRTSLPPMMWDRVHKDLRDDRNYYPVAFDLILDLYRIPHTDLAVSDLRESLTQATSL